MLRSTKKMKEFALGASDGRIGHIEEFYFDDTHWTIRFLVAQAGNWLTGRMVLISPHLLGRPDDVGKVLSVRLSRERIKAGPSPETNRPVTRQFEEAYYRYFGWPYYWAGPFLWGPSPFPVAPGASMEDGMPIGQGKHAPEAPGDPHLRSTDEVTGYHLRAQDGEIGHVEDFLYDDQDWSIKYLVAGTRNWWPGKQVLVPPEWIGAIHWEDRTVDVDASQAEIRQAPVFDKDRPMTPEYENFLKLYYSKETYQSGS